ncbi:MAG: sialidase family protein [Pseudohongiellaceae bacterium]
MCSNAIAGRARSHRLLIALGIAVLMSGQAAAESCAELREQHGEDHVSIHCGGAPSATLDADGRLWVAFVQNKHVYVSRSDDNGEKYTAPVKVNAIPEDTEFNGENRPKIIVAESGEVLLSWTTKTSPNFTGEIRFTRSIDSGKTFETPRTMNDDGLMTGHRFDSLFLTESGKLYLTWIDKRDLDAASARNESYPGAAIYYTVSEDLGATFTQNFRVSRNSCECCRIAIAPHGEDEVAILWRQIYDEEIRDHAIAVLGAEGEVTGLNRATVDDWYINACPHHGPTMVQADAEGEYHISWFSAGNLHSGIHYGRYDMASGVAEDIIKVDGTPGAGHPYLAKHDDTLFIVWKGFNGIASQLQMMQSRDNGASWSEPQTLFNTERASDHPLLVSSEHGVFLSWSSEEFGYMFKELSHEN